MSGVSLVEGRSCEGCTLCCKIMTITAINKPRLQMCWHCEVGVGCKIFTHPERPSECADYFCWYRQDERFGEEWHPNISHIAISYEERAKRINVCVDPDYAMSWRAEPYYSGIKAMALSILRGGGHLIVWQGADGIGVLPDRDVFLGPPKGNQVIVAGRRTTSSAEEYDIFALDANDPRLRGPRSPIKPETKS